MREFYEGGLPNPLYTIDDSYAMGAPDAETPDALKILVTEGDFSVSLCVKLPEQASKNRCIANLLEKYPNAILVGTTKKIGDNAVLFEEIMEHDYIGRLISSRRKSISESKRRDNERKSGLYQGKKNGMDRILSKHS